jgi:lactaldehyde dehydrogenase / glycolaldehyde dehydrogenase
MTDPALAAAVVGVASICTDELRRVMPLSRGPSFGDLSAHRFSGGLVKGCHDGWNHSGLGGVDGRDASDECPRKQTMSFRW